MKNMLVIVSLVFLFIFNYFIITNHIDERQSDTDIAIYKELYQQNDTIYQVVATEPGTYLVPKGSVLGAHDVDHITYTYTVELDDSKTFTEAMIDISLVSDIDHIVNIHHLFDVDISITIMENSNQASITVSVYLNHPETQEDYDVLTRQDFQLSMELGLN